MLSRALLLPLVFLAGMASLGVEFAASRLLAPYFGTSLYVWGVLIGLILLYLSAGYVLGGRLADRMPRAGVLYQVTAWAGVSIGVIPLVAHPILLASQQGFASLNLGLVAGTLLAVGLLFSAPMVLLACVSPFAIRLLLTDIASGGGISGRVYALSTAGSILGTFLTVFVLLPDLGTRATFIGYSAALVLISVLGLWPRRRAYLAFGLVIVLAWVLLPSGIKPPESGRLLYERDSAYNYIQVVQEGTRTELLLNEGHALHSVYDPTIGPTGYWDYFLVAGAFQPAVSEEPIPARVALLGLAGGTAARQISLAYGPAVDITGVEIDPALVDVGRRYFHMDEANLHPVVGDARYWLATNRGTFDVIGLDAYRQPYVPFHLTTREFFASVHAHLAPNGVVAVNAGRTNTDYRLVAALASTMAAVFPSVTLVDVPGFGNTIIYGSMRPISMADVTANLQLYKHPLAAGVAGTVLTDGKLRPSPYHGQVFTDDLAPVEKIIDQIVLGYATGR